MQNLEKGLISKETIEDIKSQSLYIEREGFIKFLHLFLLFESNTDTSFDVNLLKCTNNDFLIQTEFKPFKGHDSVITEEQINKFITFFDSLKIESGTVTLKSGCNPLIFEFKHIGRYIIKISQFDFNYMLKKITQGSCKKDYIANCILSFVLSGDKSFRFDVSFSNYFQKNLYNLFLVPTKLLEEFILTKNDENDYGYKEIQFIKEYNFFNLYKNTTYFDITLVFLDQTKKISLKLHKNN